jgi:hypothetical protein
MKTTLEWHEAAMASDVGRMRHLASVKAGRTPGYGYEGLAWTEHIEGACGEMALAKCLRIYWDGSVNTFKANDLPGIQVRTRSREDYQLIVRPGDSKEAAYVLVTGRCPNYEIRGWIAGKDAMREEWLKDHGNRPAAYFVPHSALQPMSTLEVCR